MLNSNHLTRRQFLAAAATSVSASSPILARTTRIRADHKLALLGGEPVRKNKLWPDWPYCDERVIDSIVTTTKSRKWCRIQAPESGTVATFEREFARLMGARFCVATGSGTQALHTCVEALGIGPGDEVITSAYTDPGTIASILASRALPVLADLDPESYQLDPADVEARITDRTRAIMPVHIMGQPCNLDAIMRIARKHHLKVIEDACQAHLAEYQGRKVGAIADLGCFSFQSSKTLACGEGGAILGNDEELMDRCFTIHNHGTSKLGRTELAGPKYRMNELEAALLLGQLPGLEERSLRRNKNATYLTSRLQEVPGVSPQKLYAGTESGSFYIYAMTYHKERFDNVPRDTFFKALAAEGVNLGGYIEQGLHREPWVETILNSELYRKMYGRKRIDKYLKEVPCPNCDRVCAEMARMAGSGPLTGTRGDMDDIADAVAKVYENRSALRS